MTDIESEIIAAGANVAPRVTPAGIDANIGCEYYFTAEDGVRGEHLTDDTRPAMGYPDSLKLLTFCVLVLKNGYTVTGESACVSAENFNAEIGRKIARTNAVQKIWPLMGYALAEKLAAQ